MAAFLARQIPQLTRAVVMVEIPASERRTASRRRYDPAALNEASRSRASKRSGGSR